MQNGGIDYTNQKEFHIFVASSYPDLKEFKVNGELAAFNKLLLKTLPQVKRYITNRMNTALSKGKLPREKCQSDEFFNQLFIVAYNYLEEVQSEEDLHPWLFKKADGIMENTIFDEEYDNSFYEKIDIFSKSDWDEMEKAFCIDGDRRLGMMDERDDISFSKKNYVLNHVFVEDDNNEMIWQLRNDWGEENIRKHADLVLYHLPLPMRTVFELATEYHLTLEEIALIRNRSFAEVWRLLENAREALEVSFYNRYNGKV